jgi:hypothetical protein
MMVLRKPVRSLDDEQYRKLASLRDGLLLKLMRGEVRVKL